MPNKNYIRGRKFEYKVKKEISCPLKHKKYGCFSFRTAGSHGPFDVGGICFLDKNILLVQCKTSKGNKDTIMINEWNGYMHIRFEKWIK